MITIIVGIPGPLQKHCYWARCGKSHDSTTFSRIKFQLCDAHSGCLFSPLLHKCLTCVRIFRKCWKKILFIQFWLMMWNCGTTNRDPLLEMTLLWNRHFLTVHTIFRVALPFHGRIKFHDRSDYIASEVKWKTQAKLVSVQTDMFV